MTMIRKQFFIDPEASRRLKDAAQRRGVSEADLIRRSIERVLSDDQPAEKDWRIGFKSFVSGLTHREHDALADRVKQQKLEQRERLTSRLAANRKQSG
jgi:hypothetical protein